MRLMHLIQFIHRIYLNLSQDRHNLKMKPILKQKLEQLLDAEFVEAEFAEAEAVAEVEQAQPKVSPYRVNEDISYKLDIPRDVAGLVGLLEEGQEHKKDIIKIQSEKLHFSLPYTMLGVVSGFLVGAVPGAAAMGYWYYLSNLNAYAGGAGILSLILGGFVGTVVGGISIDDYMSKKSARARRLEADKQRRIQELQEKLEPIDQKLSHYQTKYSTGDILLLDDKELGYCLGDVVVEKEERILRQRYVIDMPDDGYRSYTRTKAIKNEEIICVLNPKEGLSVDDLLSLDSQTPVLWQDGDYGFFRRKDQEDQFVISTQKGLYIPSQQDSYTFQQIESGEITPRLLVPEIKSRI